MDSERREGAEGVIPIPRRSVEPQKTKAQDKYQPQEFMGYDQLQEVVTITNQQLSHCLESMDTQDSPKEVYKQVYTPMLIKTQKREEKIFLRILDTGNTLAYSVMVVELQQELKL